MEYLTGVSNDYTRAAAQGDLFGQLGVLLGPATFGGPGTKADYSSHLGCYSSWGLDNGCFNGHEFDESKWLGRLEWIINEVPDAWERCSFAVAPDVVGDPVATLKRSLPLLPKIRAAGAPAALVLQDGAELMLDRLPWGQFDVAFIGGGDEFKLGYPHHLEAARLPAYDPESESTLDFMRLCWRCLEEGVEIHLGRCNSYTRMCYAVGIGAESVDGTGVAFGGEKFLEQLSRWLPAINWQTAAA